MQWLMKNGKIAGKFGKMVNANRFSILNLSKVDREAYDDNVNWMVPIIAKGNNCLEFHQDWNIWAAWCSSESKIVEKLMNCALNRKY